MAKILIVDDRPINREALALLLDENHHEVFEAEDGLQALQLARQKKIDLIITDIAMPCYDGVYLVKELSADPTLATIPVIFYSASYKAAEAHRLASSANVKYVLTKPCQPEIILGTIEGAMDPNSNFFNVEKHTQAFKNIDMIPRSDAGSVQNIALKMENKKDTTLADRNLLLTNLIEIGLDMSMEHDIKKLSYIACRGGKQLLSADFAGIILKKPQESHQYINFMLGTHSGFVTYEFTESSLTESLKQIFIHDKSQCLHSPIIEVEKIGIHHIALPFASLLCLPIKTARGVYGKIYFINKDNSRIFTLSNQRYMMTLADKFSINYENLILYQEIEHYMEKLKGEVAQRIQTEEKLRIYRKQMNETLRANSLGELASSLAHELNQPLAAIAAYVKGCIKRIDIKKELTPEIIKTLNETAFQAERAGEIIHRLKNFVRKGELYFEDIDLNVFVKEVIQLIQHELQSSEVKITYNQNINVAKIAMDKIQMQQVMINLLRNAIEAMLEANIPTPTIIINIFEFQENRIIIEIMDNGPGYPEHLENNLFELYFTTKTQGMGMGLAMCRSIIEAHAGQITAKRLSTGGSCFRLDLPFKVATLQKT